MNDENKSAKDVNMPSDAQPAPVSPPENTPPASQPATAEQLTNAETNIETRMSSFERATLRWTRAMFVVTTATAFFIGFQWKEMHDAGTQTDKIIAADERLAAAMEKSVTNAGTTLNASIDQFHLEQRAWVGPTDIRLNQELKEITPPNSISAKITMSNTGKTPALKTTVNYLIHASDIPLNIDQYMKHPVEGATKIHPRFTLYPNATMFLLPATGTTDALGIQSVGNGRKFLYVIGRITYEDVFQKPHETRFCAQYDSRTQGFSTCDSYNYTD